MVLSRSFFAALFLLFSISVVNAYTVVMRDGRRVEIPNEFTVTNSTLTYDVGNGMQITIQLNAGAEAAANEAQFGSLRRSSDDIRFVDSFGGFSSFDGIGFGVTDGRFNRFRRFPPSPFDGFLATPITPFPRFQSNPRRLVFQPRGVRNNPRPHGRRGSRR